MRCKCCDDINGSYRRELEDDYCDECYQWVRPDSSLLFDDPIDDILEEWIDEEMEDQTDE